MAEISDVSFNGTDMKYARFGKGKKNFVIIPGLSVGSVAVAGDDIEKTFAQFCDEYTCYLFDRRSNPPTDYSIHGMAEDTLCIMKHLGIDSTYFYGASQGGMITFDLALNHPEAALACVIASSTDKCLGCMPTAIENWISCAEKHDSKALSASFTESVYSNATQQMLKEGNIVLPDQYTQKELDDFLTIAKPIRNYDLSNDIDKIKVPMLIIASEGDRIFSAEPSKRIAERTGCELYIYPDSYGHAVYDEAPDFVNRTYEYLNNH